MTQQSAKTRTELELQLFSARKQQHVTCWASAGPVKLTPANKLNLMERDIISRRRVCVRVRWEVNHSSPEEEKYYHLKRKRNIIG